LFVRGLQGSWNYWSRRLNIRIPHGDVIVFSLSCGQIMYAFLMNPATIPRSYNLWIQTASKVLPQTVSMNHDLVRTHKFDLKDLETMIKWKRTTPNNKIVLNELMASAKKGNFGVPFARCEVTHPWLDSCKAVEVERFFQVSLWMAPIYGALHFIPMLLFKRAQFMKDPVKMLSRSAYGTLRSSTFLGIFVVIFQSCFCAKNQLWLSKFKLSPMFRWFLASKQSFWLLGMLSGLSLFVEDKRRRGELAMYVLPRGLESAWSVMRNRGWVPFLPFGESILCAIGMGMVMATYQDSPEHLSGLVRRVLYQFIGPN